MTDTTAAAQGQPNETKDQADERKGDANKRFVVLHSRLGYDHERGYVVSEKDLGQENVQRLLNVGAIREARAEEKDSASVTMIDDPLPDKHQSFEQQVAEKDKQIAAMLQEKADLVTRLSDEQRQRAEAMERAPTQGAQEIVRAKDQRIAELERQLAESKGKVANVDPGDEGRGKDKGKTGR